MQSFSIAEAWVARRRRREGVFLLIRESIVVAPARGLLERRFRSLGRRAISVVSLKLRDINWRLWHSPANRNVLFGNSEMYLFATTNQLFFYSWSSIILLNLLLNQSSGCHGCLHQQGFQLNHWVSTNAACQRPRSTNQDATIAPSPPLFPQGWGIRCRILWEPSEGNLQMREGQGTPGGSRNNMNLTSSQKITSRTSCPATVPLFVKE